MTTFIIFSSVFKRPLNWEVKVIMNWKAVENETLYFFSTPRNSSTEDL